MRLAAVRTAAGLTQRELARRAGIPASVLCAYEQGVRMPGAATFARIVRASGGEVLVRGRTAAQLQHADEDLQDVLALAELLPYRDPGPLRYPAIKDRGAVAP